MQLSLKIFKKAKENSFFSFSEYLSKFEVGFTKSCNWQNFCPLSRQQHLICWFPPYIKRKHTSDTAVRSNYSLIS